MDNPTKSGIILRTNTPGVPRIPDIKLFFSKLWQNSKEVAAVVEAIKCGKISPEKSLQILFDGTTEDPLLFCFLVLISLKNKDAIELCDDLQVLPKERRVYNGVDEAVDWFFHIYKKERICSGRHDYGRKKPRTAA